MLIHPPPTPFFDPLSSVCLPQDSQGFRPGRQTKPLRHIQCFVEYFPLRSPSEPLCCLTARVLVRWQLPATTSYSAAGFKED